MTAMPPPIILTVDDDPEVSRSLARDLRQQYGEDYRIRRAESGPAALDRLKELKLRDEQVGLLLADHRMPEMTGVEFLEQSRQFFPKARRVLLTAYADTDAAIGAINRADVDYYMLKPRDPPQEKLYPVLDDLLEDWKMQDRLTSDDRIRVVGHRWSAPSHAVKDFLTRNQVPFKWLELERDPEAARLLAANGGDRERLPLVITDGGRTLQAPSTAELAGALGLSTTPSLPFYDLIVIGAGPAGLGAAVYGASEGLRTVLVEREAVGGQAGQSARIENYLGFPSGIAGGPSLERSMSHYLIEQIGQLANVRVRTNSEIVEASGGDHLERVRIADRQAGTEEEVETSWLFVFIGAAPGTDWLGKEVLRDDNGFVLTGPDLVVDGQLPPDWPLERHPYFLETSVPGVFAAGDVRCQSVKRVASAVGEGAMAVTLVHRYLELL